MKICFTSNFKKYSPKGDVLQLLNLLKAIDKKVERISSTSNQEFLIDCVLPFLFVNGYEGFDFRYVKFHESENQASKIAQMDDKENYDFIFVRNRQLALDLIRINEKLASKMLYLSIQYDEDDKAMMEEMDYLFKNSKMIFFQSVPWAERFKDYVCRNGVSPEIVERKVKILAPYVEPLLDNEISLINRSSPPHLIMAGVIRPLFGLSIAIQAVHQIRQFSPDAHLHLVYPKIEKSYKKTALGLMKDKAIMDHGKKSVRETKKMILTAGIGLALVYDNTPGQNHYYTYLTRILDYLSLGVPVITTKTAGNVHLLGHNYPLFVEDAQDIVRCYLRLMEPDFYREMSDLSKNIGRQFVGEVAVEDFWSILESQMPARK